MAPATRNDDHLQQRLRHAGLRATGARTAVLRALAGAGGPASAHDLAQRIGPRAADRVTVYRALNAFVEHGLAHRMDPGDRVWRFALAEAPAHAHDTPPHAPHASHPHFVCNDCGDIRCLDDDAVSIRLQPSRLERRATVTAREIVLRGTCQRCNDNP